LCTQRQWPWPTWLMASVMLARNISRAFAYRPVMATSGRRSRPGPFVSLFAHLQRVNLRGGVVVLEEESHLGRSVQFDPPDDDFSTFFFGLFYRSHFTTLVLLPRPVYISPSSKPRSNHAYPTYQRRWPTIKSVFTIYPLFGRHFAESRSHRVSRPSPYSAIMDR